MYDYIIVGAGFAGCTLANRLAEDLGSRVLIVEKRDHIGGNAFDQANEAGILVQRYGPHIFHTNSERVWLFLSRFTRWNGYVHRVLASVKGKEVPLPISIETMEQLYERPFTEETMREFLDSNKTVIEQVRNARDVVVSQVGEELYELFFKNYTKKHWGVYPEELSPEVTSRLPVRFNRDTRYFSDKYQGLPCDGFTAMFQKIIDHPNIQLLLATDFKNIAETVNFSRCIYTGPIDSYFDYVHGKLPYRSLEFHFETLPRERFQGGSVVNYPNDNEFTRITEFKYLYKQENPNTTICREYPKAEGDPYYPIPNSASQEIYLKYKEETKKLKTVYFIGRLAEYRYLNMDQVVDRALELFEEISNG